jgi:carboxymethylenebutenolidase
MTAGAGAARTESVTVADGSFDLHVWLPGAGRGPGLVLIQEIFGVGAYIRAVAADLAALGYVVAAPDLFWRLQRGWEADHDEEGLKASVGLASRLDADAAVADLTAVHAHLSGRPEATGPIGALGFCLGGSMAYLLAARVELAAAVSFYGSSVPSRLDALDEIGCPVQFHFGGSDPYIPRDQVAAVERAVAERPDMEIHVQEDAGHAFHNRKAPMFYQPEPARRAWELTERFLARHLPT